MPLRDILGLPPGQAITPKDLEQIEQMSENGIRACVEHTTPALSQNLTYS